MSRMSTQVVDGPEIVIGYPWSATLYVDAGDLVLFPVDGTFKAQVRRQVDGPVLATLTTANLGLVRVSDSAITLAISAADTADMAVGSVSLDLIRTDTSPPSYVGIRMTIPVSAPVTRPS